jgi:membrane-associated phospholipid phosphatase
LPDNYCSYFYNMLAFNSQQLIFLKTVEQWDQWLFFQVNRHFTNSLFDNVFPWWRNQDTWIPVYLFLLLFMLMNFGWRSWKWVVFIGITIAITDQISSSVLKDFFNRTRPCRDPLIAPYIRFLGNYCPQSGSFTSSHAANHFAAAVFIHKTLGLYFKKWTGLFYFWAASICYAQVYVGVHYPLDVAGGAILGTLIALLTARLYSKTLKSQLVS